MFGAWKNRRQKSTAAWPYALCFDTMPSNFIHTQESMVEGFGNVGKLQIRRRHPSYERLFCFICSHHRYVIGPELHCLPHLICHHGMIVVLARYAFTSMT